MAGTGFGGPLKDKVSVGPYKYRSGLGFSPSAEFLVVHDDFVTPVTSNVPDGGLWQAAIIDTAATCLINQTVTTSANGVIALTDATASEGIAIYTEQQFQLIAGKKFMMEVRLRTDDVTDNTVYFGLSALNATTNPEDLYTTASTDLIAMGILDATDTTGGPGLFVDTGNGGTSLQTQTARVMVVDTWHTMAIYYDGVNVSTWMDGNKVIASSQASTTVPTPIALGAFLAMRNGNGAGGNTLLVDYVRIISER